MNSEREELIEALRKTRERFGVIYPVIKTRDGQVIDGHHRLEADPDWPSVEIDLEHPWDALMIRIIANNVRRDVSPEEKREALNELAQATGWTPKEIAEELGVSYSWVMKYLAAEHKERPGAGGPKRVTRRETQFEKGVRALGLEAPRAPKIPTSTCPLCGCRASAEVLALKYEEFKYGEPELTVVQLMERKRRGGA